MNRFYRSLMFADDTWSSNDQVQNKLERFTSEPFFYRSLIFAGDTQNPTHWKHNKLESLSLFNIFSVVDEKVPSTVEHLKGSKLR